MTWQEKYRMIVSVYLILKNDRDEILLLKRQNTGYCDGLYGLPAGHVDGGESVYAAMAREAREEAGVGVDEGDLRLAHTMHRNCGDHERIDLFFVCSRWDGEPTNMEPHKCAELAWYPMRALPENVIGYYLQAFECIQKNEPLSTLDF